MSRANDQSDPSVVGNSVSSDDTKSQRTSSDSEAQASAPTAPGPGAGPQSTSQSQSSESTAATATTTSRPTTTNTQSNEEKSGSRGRGGRRSKKKKKKRNQTPEFDIPVSHHPYVDTHCHLEYILQRYKCVGPDGFQQLQQKQPFPPNFEACVSVFCDPAAFSSFGMWRELLEHKQVYGAFGIHPHNAKYYSDAIEEKIVECLKHPKAVAWGECGLDYHYKHSPRDVQRQVFARQLQIASLHEVPIVVHSRDAFQDTFDIMKEHMDQKACVHIHCFGDTAEQAQQYLDYFPNAYIGITGAVTFASADQLRDVVKAVPLDRMVVETDGPYMPPAGAKPRVRNNHPGLIPYVVHQIAKVKGATTDDVLIAVREATKAMYGI
jgi:TatD DNase family protein